MNTQNDPLISGIAEPRTTSSFSYRQFLAWTAFWWGGVGILLLLFFIGTLDFVTSTKAALYGISIWLNAWILTYFTAKNKVRSKIDLYHDCLVVWMLSYAMTNILWEIPWVIFSPFIFQDLHTLDDVIAYTDYMRESPLHLYWWMIGSFASVDLRTVNHDPTFYTLEIYSFVNVASVFYFFYLNNKCSPYRYLIPVLGSGEPIASTFIFSFTEVFADFENMPGGIADTLLALVWTQYQYFFFPMVFGVMGCKLLMEDWRYCYENSTKNVEKK